MKNTILSLSVITIIAMPVLAHAQNSWWDTANKALNSDAGKQAIQSLTNIQPQTGTTTPAVTAPSLSGLSNVQMNAGLKDALKIGTQTVVKQLGKEGGFSLDPKIKIPLPGPIAKADLTLKKFGLGSLTADLEARINRAAEIATPKAGALFVSAIQKMTVTDAQAILTGPRIQRHNISVKLWARNWPSKCNRSLRNLCLKPVR